LIRFVVAPDATKTLGQLDKFVTTARWLPAATWSKERWVFPHQDGARPELRPMITLRRVI
jgi:hypothetical protein